MRSLVRRCVLVITLGLTGLSAGCLTAPTLPPLPPPAAEVSAPVEGEVVITGSVEEDTGAMVLALNNDTGVIAGQLLEEGETRFSIRLRAEPDHTLSVFYRAHDEQSGVTALTVPALVAPAAP